VASGGARPSPDNGGALSHKKSGVTRGARCPPGALPANPGGLPGDQYLDAPVDGTAEGGCVVLERLIPLHPIGGDRRRLDARARCLSSWARTRARGNAGAESTRSIVSQGEEN
jgi:hypothetical protein